MNTMHRSLGLLVVGFAVLGAACSSAQSPSASNVTTSTSTSTTSQPTTTTTAKPTTPAGLVIEITEFAPFGGHDINVNFQATNTGRTEQRFEWAQYVLTAPDGSTHTAYQDPTSAPYELISAAGVEFNGGIFQFPTYTPGHYKISYGGKVLQEKDL